MSTVSFKADEELRKMLTLLSKTLGLNRSEVIREAIKRLYLEVFSWVEE